LEDYLDSLYKHSGMSVFVIIVKQLDTFKYFSESKFDINPDKLVLMIYSIEDKGYKLLLVKVIN
jgi:hypothetical protein